MWIGLAAAQDNADSLVDQLETAQIEARGLVAVARRGRDDQLQACVESNADAVDAALGQAHDLETALQDGADPAEILPQLRNVHAQGLNALTAAKSCESAPGARVNFRTDGPVSGVVLGGVVGGATQYMRSDREALWSVAPGVSFTAGAMFQWQPHELGLGPLFGVEARYQSVPTTVLYFSGRSESAAFAHSASLGAVVGGVWIRGPVRLDASVRPQLKIIGPAPYGGGLNQRLPRLLQPVGAVGVSGTLEVDRLDLDPVLDLELSASRPGDAEALAEWSGPGLSPRSQAGLDGGGQIFAVTVRVGARFP